MCEPFKKVHIITSATVQGISLNGLVLRYEKYMGLYIGLHSKYLMLLGSEVIWAMDYSTGPIQVVYVKEVQRIITKRVAWLNREMGTRWYISSGIPDYFISWWYYPIS